jgi:hypothetical protein
MDRPSKESLESKSVDRPWFRKAWFVLAVLVPVGALIIWTALLWFFEFTGRMPMHPVNAP